MNIYSKLITLGPKGTDAENLASKFSKDIILVGSFEKAMEVAYDNNYIAFICCGFQEREGDHITDGWVNLHFRWFGRMEIVETLHHKTKPMCIAIRKGCTNPKSIVIHPSTFTLLNTLNTFQFHGLEVHYVNNKPSAVEKVVEGTYDLCIGSLDIVQRFPEILEPVEIFQPQMVWAFYQRS